MQKSAESHRGLQLAERMMFVCKKFLCLLLALLIVLAGCSTISDDTPAATNTQDPTISEPVIKQDSETSRNLEQDPGPMEPEPNTETDINTEAESAQSTEPVTPGELEPPTTESLEVHFLDVGQADSILVKAPGGVMLIDAGNNADADDVVSYLKNQGVSKIDVLVGTHPHEDHIGGLDAVIDTFDVSKIYMPKASTTTKTFEDVLLAIQRKGLKVTTPTAGSSFDLGSANCTILAPNSDTYDDLNDYSIVLKMEYGQTSFLFTGDAETASEQEMLQKKYDLKADVLKVGHHGSSSSTSPAFLKAVSPKHAVISVGKNNQYGHPDSVILNRLSVYGAEIYRTDESGTIIAISDGESITFDKQASPVKENAPPVDEENNQSSAPTQETVYITKTGEKYHKEGCRYLSKSKIPIDLSEAIASGYGPCSVCNPPVLSNRAETDNKTIAANNKNTKEENNTTNHTPIEKKEITVYITKTGEKYHTAGCSYLKKSKIPIELSDAKNNGYTPCSRCNPSR